MKMLSKIALLLALAFPAAANAQAVQQSGQVSPNSSPVWVTNGVISGGNTAADSPLSSFGITNSTTAGLCISSGRASAAGRQQLCLGAPLAASAVISLQNYGTATAQNLSFIINGTTVTIPTGGGGTIPSITTPLVNGNIICASGTAGTLAGCTLGTAGQVLVGQGATAPVWRTLSGDVSTISSAGAVTLAKVNGVTFPASPAIGSAPYVSSSNTITYGAIPVTGGGTGAATFTAAGVLVGNGTSPVTAVTTASIGLCLLSNGTGVTPSWGGCASGAGSAAGSNTQVQFNNSSALAGSANLTWVSPALTIGVNATATGQLVLANGGAIGTSVTIQNTATTSAYNFNLPISAGTSGQPMISGGGGSAAMQFGTLGIVGGGTACAAASGTCLDNITGFSGAGFINRTGAGSYSFTAQIGLANGGTAANLTASNGGIVYSTAGAMAILNGTATAGQILVSGSNSAPSWSTASFPTTCAVSGILYASSANVITCLATANNGVLITSAGGVPSIGSTLPSAVQANITATGTVASGVWQGTPVALLYGGTNAALTASNGGIFYSTATAGAILSGTATASFPLLSGSTAAPTWATITYPTSGTSGGIAYFSSATAISSSALLTANQIVVGGGAGSAPTTFACATTTTVVHGGTPPTCSQIVAGDITNATITNAKLAVANDSTIKSNISGGSTSPSDNTITAVLDKQFGTTQGSVIYRNGTVWTALTPGSTGQFLTTQGAAADPTWSSGGAGTGTVTSVTPGTGLVSSITTSCSQGAITASGTLYAAECVNPQTGTSYAIVDGDRAKLVTASNAAAQAYTIAQAGNSSAFQAGWYVDVKNVSTNAAGIVTITPTTSTIDGASTYVLNPGRSARIVSDGTNYQISTTGAKPTLPTVQSFTSGSGTYTTPANVQWIKIRIVGAGGGGAGSGTSPGTATAGGNTTFSGLTGSGGTAGSGTGGGTGGAASGGNINTAGSDGWPSPVALNVSTSYVAGGAGGPSCMGGSGRGGAPGSSDGAAGKTNSGSGGGGGSGNLINGGGGGAAGGCVEFIQNSPAATYSYGVGTGGTAGTAGSSGQAGGAGGAGFIYIEEHYNN